MVFSVVRYSFIYLCWNGTASCRLLTWAETKRVRQLIIHGAIISSINMVITGTSRGISQPNSPSPGEGSPKERLSPPENSPAHSLRSCRIWIFFFFLSNYLTNVFCSFIKVCIWEFTYYLSNSVVCHQITVSFIIKI